MEPNWTKQITSNTICNFFYAFFVLYVVMAVLAIVAFVGFFGSMKKAGTLGVAAMVSQILYIALASTFARFFYLICDRALLAKVKEAFTN